MTVVMAYNLEKKKIYHSLDKDYEGASPYEPGIRIEKPATTESDGWGISDSIEYDEMYLFEVVKDIAERWEKFRRAHPDWQQLYSVYFGWHVTSKPMTWDEASSQLVMKSMGIPEYLDVQHQFSDLTGYLWTNVYSQDSEGHDVYKELAEQCIYETKTTGSGKNRKWTPVDKYLTLKFEVAEKG